MGIKICKENQNSFIGTKIFMAEIQKYMEKEKYVWGPK